MVFLASGVPVDEQGAALPKNCFARDEKDKFMYEAVVAGALKSVASQGEGEDFCLALRRWTALSLCSFRL